MQRNRGDKRDAGRRRSGVISHRGFPGKPLKDRDHVPFRSVFLDASPKVSINKYLRVNCTGMESSIHERTKQTENSQENYKLVGFEKKNKTGLGKWHFVWAEEKMAIKLQSTEA